MTAFLRRLLGVRHGASVRLLLEYFANQREQSRVVHWLLKETGGSAGLGPLLKFLRRVGGNENDRNGPLP